MRFRPIRLVTATAIALLCAAWGPDSPRAAEPPSATTGKVSIAALFELSGRFADLGGGGAPGVELAVKQINGAGGFQVAGKKYLLDLVIADTQSDAAQAVSQAKQLLRDRKIVAMFGPGTGVNAMPVSEVTYDRKVIQFAPATQFDSILGTPRGKYIFKTQPSEDVIARLYVPYVIQALKLKSTIATIMPNDASAKMILAASKPEFEKRGIKVVAEEWFESGTTDFTPYLTKIKGLKAEAIFAGYNDVVGIPLLRQMEELDAAPALLGRAFSTRIAVKDAVGGPVSRLFVTHTPSLNLEAPTLATVEKFVRDYQEQFKVHPKEGLRYWALAYFDHVYALVEAMKQAGTVEDTDKIAAALEKLRYDGLQPLRYEQHRVVHGFDAALVTGGKVQWVHLNP